MRYIIDEKGKFFISQPNPIRHEFFSAEMSIKDQNEMLNYLKKHLKDVGVKRKDKKSVFMTTRENKSRCLRYCFDNLQELITNYNIKGYIIDLEDMK